jgi:integrase
MPTLETHLTVAPATPQPEGRIRKKPYGRRGGQTRPPKLCRHRATGQAVVRLNGQDKYCGRWGTAEAESKYHALISEYMRQGVVIESPGRRMATVAEVAAAYLLHVTADRGPRSDELSHTRAALKVLLELHRSTAVEAFGPLALKGVQQALCRSTCRGRQLARKTVNKHVRRIVRMMKWAAGEEHIETHVHQRLTVVEGLRYGRGGRETGRRHPVAWKQVRKVKPHLQPLVWRMVLVQWLTGMRSEEVCQMTPAEIDRTGSIWVYTPVDHKGKSRGKERLVPLGPRAQRVLRSPLKGLRDREAVFSPRRAVAGLQTARRRARKTPLYPSHLARQAAKRAARPRRPPRETYTADSYWRAVDRACERAGIEHWTPHQLRHSLATRARSRFDMDTARALLGQATMGVTFEYADLDLRKAKRAAAAMG